jgi:ribosome maturation factor RimP
LLLPGGLCILKCLVVEIARLSGLFFLEWEEMLEIKETINSLLTAILDQHQAFLIDVVVRSERGGKLVQVLLDTDSGVTIEQCAQISRELAGEIDRKNLIETSYRLEVSSPGIDKPLKLLRQYHKNIGRRFKVTFEKTGAKATVVGSLSSVIEDKLTFVPDNGEPLTLRFSEIIESKEELPW